MRLRFPSSLALQKIDWTQVPSSVSNGETGTSIAKSIEIDGIRVRRVIYSSNYKADHWCSKGHFIYVIEGEMLLKQLKGESMRFQDGDFCLVGDESDSHALETEKGVELLIID